MSCSNLQIMMSDITENGYGFFCVGKNFYAHSWGELFLVNWNLKSNVEVRYDIL